MAQWAIALLWIVLLLGALAKWSLSTMGSQGRLLFPALPVVSTVLIVGLFAWWPANRAKGQKLTVMAMAPLAILALYLPFAYIRPAYQTPHLQQADPDGNVPNPVQVSFGGHLLMAGYSVDRQSAQPGDSLTVRLFWQTLAPMAEDYSLFVHVYGSDGSTIGQVDSYPGGGAYATSSMAPGKALEDSYTIRLNDRAAPGAGQIAAGLYQLGSKTLVPATDGQGHSMSGAVPLSSLNIIPRDSAGFSAATPVGVNLDDKVRVAGFHVANNSLRAGETLSGQIYWQALKPMAENYTVFVQLIGPNGPVAQHDSEPLGGSYHTKDWQVGDMIGDPFKMTLPEASAGEYWLVTGMYRLESGQRLPVKTGVVERLFSKLSPKSGRPAIGDAVPLSLVHVTGVGQ